MIYFIYNMVRTLKGACGAVRRERPAGPRPLRSDGGWRRLGLLASAGLLGAALACHTSTPSLSLVAGASIITLGDSTTLTPGFPGKSGSATLDHDIGKVTSGVPVPITPTADTTYTLTFKPRATSYATSTTVRVVAAPNITSFTAAESLVTTGTPATLTAVFQDGTGIIEPGDLPVTSNVPVATGNLAQETTFTLTVTNDAGRTATQTVLVGISGPPVTPVLTAPAYVTSGATGLAAAVTNAAAEPSGSTYAWTLTNGTIQGSATGTSIVFTAGASGTVGLSCVATNPGGTPSAAGHASCTIVGVPGVPVLSVPAKVTANATGLAASVGNAASLPAGTTFAWSATGGTITPPATGTSVTFSAGASGTVAFTCVATTLAGGASTGTANSAIVAPPVTPVLSVPAYVTGNATGLAASVTNTASEPAGTIYTWTSPNGGALNIAGNGTSSITFTAAGSGTAAFSCTATNFAGGTTSAAGTASSSIVAAPGTPALSAPLYVTANATGLTATVSNAASLPAGTTFAWSATGGTITPPATGASITFSAGASGSVAFTCVATNLGGTQSTGTTSSTIVAAPTLPVISGVLPYFTAGATHITASVPTQANSTYYWTVTGGTIFSGGTTADASVVFTVPSTGTLTVTCSVHNQAGTASALATATSTVVAAPATPVVTPSKTAVTAGTGGYTATVPVQPTGSTYVWAFAGGSISTGQGTSSVTFAAGGTAGAFALTCTISNAAGLAGTAGSVNITVYATPATPVVAPSKTAVTVSTGGYTATVPAQPAGSTYAWAFAGGTVSAGQGTNSITFAADGTVGAFALTCTITNGAGLAGTAGSVTITIYATPATPVITAPATVTASTGGYAATVPAQPAGSSYAWAFAGGTVSTGQGTNAITFAALGSTGTFALTCTITNGAGLAGTAGSVTITIYAAPATPAITPSDTTVTVSTGGYTATVPAQPSGSSYVWAFAGGSISTGQGTNSITYAAGGSAGGFALTCTITNGAGLAGTAGSVTINVFATPATPAITPSDTTVTASTGGYTATVPAQPIGSSYAWAFAGGSISTGQGTNSVTYAAGVTAGTFALTCTITNGAGLAGTAGSVNVTIYAAPATPVVSAAVTALVTGSGPHTASVPAQPVGSSYAWSFTGGTFTGQGSATIAYTAGATGGDFEISCTITNGAGLAGSAGTAAIHVYATPVLNVPASVGVRQPNLTASTSTSEPAGTTYVWTLSGTDGAIHGSGASITFDAPSTDPITLTCAASDGLGVTSPAASATWTAGVRTSGLNLSISDGAAEDWAAIGVKLLGVSLIPQGGSAASAVPVYAAPVPAPTVNLVALDQLGELLGQLPVPPGTYTGAVLTLAGNPGDVALVAGADPSAGFPEAAATTVPAGRIQIQGATGAAGSRTVPVTVAFATSLVQPAGQNQALDLEFDLAHAAFLVDHRTAGDPAPVWAVNFDGTVRHRAAAGTSLVLRHLYGTGTGVTGTPGALAVTKLFPAGLGAQASAQRLTLFADPAQGTQVQDLDTGTGSTLADFAGAAGTFTGRYLRIAARTQADGSLRAVRMWVSSSFARVAAGAEGHVLHLDAGAGLLAVEDASGRRVPVQVTAATRFFLRNPGDPQADATPIGTGTGALGSLFVRGFKVHASLDASTTPATALTVDIETAKFEGTLAGHTGQGLTLVRRFATAADGYTVNLGYGRTATQVGSGAGPADAGGLILAPQGVGFATWNDPAAPAAWSARAAFLKPTALPLGTLASTWTGSGFRLALPGAADSLRVDLDPAAQVYQVDRTGGKVTVTPVDPGTAAGQAWLAGNLTAGATVRAFGIPQADGRLQAGVLLVFTGDLPL